MKNLKTVLVVAVLIVMSMISCEKPNEYDVCLTKYEAGMSRMENMRIYDNDFLVGIEWELSELEGKIRPMTLGQIERLQVLHSRELVILKANFKIVGDKKSMYDLTVELN